MSRELEKNKVNLTNITCSSTGWRTSVPHAVQHSYELSKLIQGPFTYSGITGNPNNSPLRRTFLHARRRDTVAVPFDGANERERIKELSFEKTLSRRPHLVRVFVKTVYRGLPTNRIEHAEENGSLDEAVPHVPG